MVGLYPVGKENVLSSLEAFKLVCYFERQNATMFDNNTEHHTEPCPPLWLYEVQFQNTGESMSLAMPLFILPTNPRHSKSTYPTFHLVLPDTCTKSIYVPASSFYALVITLKPRLSASHLDRHILEL